MSASSCARRRTGVAGRIGVHIDQVTKDVAESIGLGKAQGALVPQRRERITGDKAGVEAGDIITRFDGKLIDRATDLPRLCSAHQPGSRATLTLFRRGGSRELACRSRRIEPENRCGALPTRKSRSPRIRRGAVSRPRVSDLNDARRRS